LIRTVNAVIASDVPLIGSDAVGAFEAFDATCNVELKLPAVVGWKTTWTVQESAAAIVGVADPQGLGPPPTASA
jgi:hypothetical protein